MASFMQDKEASLDFIQVRILFLVFMLSLRSGYFFSSMEIA